ncbi:hypothetical protein [Acinetobacter sp. ANC 4648]|uniref:hypothetical protein n=1 Tax=Acinetobacter sp. ANC 4648 TaxID=1977875 RepID=UPI000A33D45F|nr:hypothetical protein [Acinetobacter sp. ANC 4648]OTG83054.1 hypothetical protein B9T27_07230 [Acinetobacter sp. ANC 4648]
MNNPLKIKLFMLLFCISSMGYAESLANFEQKTINHYYQATCADRAECDQYNEDVSHTIIEKLKKDPTSYTYAFKALTDKNLLKILYSPDKKLKFYNFDVSSGGTMREFTTYVQYKQGNRIKTQAVENAGYIKRIQQTELHQQPLYLISKTYIGSSCEGAYALQATQLINGHYQPVKAFIAKTKTLDAITISYDCHYFPDTNDYSEMDKTFIRTAKDLKNIDVLVIQPSGHLTQNYLRYQKTKNGYQYIAVVK